MHSESPDPDDRRLDTSRVHPPRDSDLVPCSCGCGTLLGRNRWGRQRQFVLGHQMAKRSTAEWRHIYQELLDSAPLCACGCGERVRPFCGSLATFISRRNHGYYRYLRGHDKRPSNWEVELTLDERQAILGTLLGDSSIGLPNRRSTNPRLTANHGFGQRAWIEHKALALRRLGVHLSEAPNPGYGSTHIRLATRCLPCLEPIRMLVAPRGTKRISYEWLEGLGSIGLAWWIGDDGSSAGRTFNLHTEGFSNEDVQLAAEWFEDRYGPVTVRSARGYRLLYVSAPARRQLLPLVEPHLPDSMQYKLRACRLRPTQRDAGRCLRPDR